MSAQIADAVKRPTAWEVRERAKDSRRKSECLARSTARSDSSIRRGRRLGRSPSAAGVDDPDLDSEDAEIPTAFQILVRSKSQEQRLKRAGRRLAPRRGDGTTAVGKVRARERQSRKSDVLDSFTKHGLDDDDSKNLIHTLATSRSATEDEDTTSDDERSLDPSSIQKMFLAVNRKNGSPYSSSNNKSFGGSDSRHGSSECLNRSLDLSSHAGFRNTQGDITTSASDDQWARFKLLGRIGLGDIHPSAAARHMIQHNVKVITGIIKKIVALRDENDEVVSETKQNRSIEIKTGNLLAEVREAVGVKKTRARFKRDPQSITLNSRVLSELDDYVTVISFMYRDNPFHNFEHASTVLNNVNRVVSLCKPPDNIEYHDIRFVTTDPWTLFALVFTALIHDVDHAGVPNAQLIKERSHVASAYKNKSVAEQNSLEISWNLLMEPCYKNLRETLFANADDMVHFRSLVVTATLATDIADKELAAMRKDRAAAALAILDEEVPTSDDIASLKATFVLETLIQVADVSHLMMPFDVYKKWNYKLLRETHQAFMSGRAENDPLETWYQGEFGFFDFYIIPLAKKLDKCGIDSSFYVENATNNRKMWEEVGEGLVDGFRKTMKLAKRSNRPSFVDDVSSSESDYENASFGEEAENDTNPTTIPANATKDKLKEIRRQKAEQYNHKLVKTPKQKSFPGEKRKNAATQSERLGRSIDSCLSGGSEHIGPARRIVYKSKALLHESKATRTSTTTHKTVLNNLTAVSDTERPGRSETAIFDGQRRYKQRSKSASNESNGVDLKTDAEHHNPRSVNNRRKKKKARSRSLESSGQKKSLKGKRPSKIKSDVGDL